MSEYFHNLLTDQQTFINTVIFLAIGFSIGAPLWIMFRHLMKMHKDL